MPDIYFGRKQTVARCIDAKHLSTAFHHLIRSSTNEIHLNTYRNVRRISAPEQRLQVCVLESHEHVLCFRGRHQRDVQQPAER